VTSITNKYIALGKYTGATRASGLRYTSAKLLLAEQTHMTHYYWALQSEQMHQNTNQQRQKHTRARLAERKAKRSTHGSIENYPTQGHNNGYVVVAA
jgi:hypothetical protein